MNNDSTRKDRYTFGNSDCPDKLEKVLKVLKVLRVLKFLTYSNKVSTL